MIAELSERWRGKEWNLFSTLPGGKTPQRPSEEESGCDYHRHGDGMDDKEMDSPKEKKELPCALPDPASALLCLLFPPVSDCLEHAHDIE